MPTAWNTTTQPVAMHTGTTSGSANTWVAFTPPVRTRVITVQNRDPGANAIRWANIGTAEVAFAGGDNYVEIAAGESRTFPWTAGQSRAGGAGGVSPDVVVGSTAMSVPITLVARESKEI